jgi:arginine decarboxylase
MLQARRGWHGFGDLADGFNMLDPIKATIITPGLDVDGKFADWGIPAAIVTKYLAEHGVVVEKTGLYSFFIMFTIGITKGRWNTLVTALQQFKDDYDKNQPLWRILPEFCAASRVRAHGPARPVPADPRGLRTPTTSRADHRDVPVGHGAGDEAGRRLRRMAHREIERVPIDELEGRITTLLLLTPYPPGIPAADPGRALQPRSSTTCSSRASSTSTFPGFETDIHGLGT